MMEINYWYATAFVLLMAVLIIWLIKRNRKDEKTFEKDFAESEIKPEEHDGDKI